MRTALLCLLCALCSAGLTSLWWASKRGSEGALPIKESMPVLPKKKEETRHMTSALLPNNPVGGWLGGAGANEWLRLQGAEADELSAWFHQWNETATPEMRRQLLRQVAARPVLDTTGLLRLVLAAAVRDDPLAAAGIMHPLFLREREHWLMGDVARLWAAQDPAGAMQWFQQQFGPLAGNGFQEELTRGWARKDPQAALDHLMTRPPSSQATTRELGFIFDEISSRSGPVALADWLKGQPQDEWRAILLQTGMARLAEQDASVAAQLLPQAGEITVPARTLRKIGSGLMAMQGATSTLNWAESLPPAMQKEATAAVLDRWVMLEPAQAAEWMQRHLAQPGTAQGLASLARQLTLVAPERALEWAVIIPHAGERQEAVREVAGIWLSRDQAAAEAWMQSRLSPTEVQMVREASPSFLDHEPRE